MLLHRSIDNADNQALFLTHTPRTHHDRTTNLEQAFRGAHGAVTLTLVAPKTVPLQNHTQLHSLESGEEEADAQKDTS
jgi:hypothetical protein